MKILYERNFTISRTESGFDKACDSARERALVMLGMDEDGYAEDVEGWNRSTDFIEIVFVSLSIMGDMCGGGYIYSFVCRACRNEEE